MSFSISNRFDKSAHFCDSIVSHFITLVISIDVLRSFLGRIHRSLNAKKRQIDEKVRSQVMRWRLIDHFKVSKKKLVANSSKTDSLVICSWSAHSPICHYSKKTEYILQYFWVVTLIWRDLWMPHQNVIL